ncbi:hypothetical protein HK405_001635 [Cladochytrium tenue]|nr:hypothetical protein HK405_001635 [Cladochytrium tenue]
MPKRKATLNAAVDDNTPPVATAGASADPLSVTVNAHPDDLTDSPRNFLSLPAAARRDLAAARAARGVFFAVEPSLSSRSRCKGCRRPIEAGALRFWHVVCCRNCCAEKRTGVRDACGRWHVGCLLEAQAASQDPFVQCSPGWRPIQSTSQLVGFGNLSEAQQDAIREALTTENNNAPAKKGTKKARK